MNRFAEDLPGVFREFQNIQSVANLNNFWGFFFQPSAQFTGRNWGGKFFIFSGVKCLKFLYNNIEKNENLKGKILKNPLQKHWKIPKNSFTKIENLKGKRAKIPLKVLSKFCFQSTGKPFDPIRKVSRAETLRSFEHTLRSWNSHWSSNRQKISYTEITLVEGPFGRSIVDFTWHSIGLFFRFRAAEFFRRRRIVGSY